MLASMHGQTRPVLSERGPGPLSSFTASVPRRRCQDRPLIVGTQWTVEQEVAAHDVTQTRDPDATRHRVLGQQVKRGRQAWGLTATRGSGSERPGQTKHIQSSRETENKRQKRTFDGPSLLDKRVMWMLLWPEGHTGITSTSHHYAVWLLECTNLRVVPHSCPRDNFTTRTFRVHGSILNSSSFNCTFFFFFLPSLSMGLHICWFILNKSQTTF